jgi:putative serine protease PepD
MSLQMPRRPRPSLIASLLAVACLGVGGGALLSSSLSSNNDTKTVVRQVTVRGSQPASTTSPLSVNEIYRRAYKGVVELTVSSTGQNPLGGGSGAQQAQGSGFVYDSNGDIVTNQHVVDGGSSISVRFWNGKTYDATLVGTDRSTDLAVVKVSAPASELAPLSLGDSSKLVVGDGVVAIGSPFGLEETVTSGIVSALHRSIDAPNNFTIPDSIQTDAAINHGNSGGPLLNAEGQVIGVTAQIRSESGDNAGVGFSNPSNTIRSIARVLISTGKVEHAYLGVSLDSTAPKARVAGVRSGTPAERAGIRAGDVVTTFDGTQISTSDDLARAINAHKPGDTVSVTYLRDGKSHTVTLKLVTRPS